MTPLVVPKVTTPLGQPELAAVLRDGHHGVVGTFPSAERLGVAWAQCCLEHKRGKAIYNHNIGNVTAFGGWPGDYYTIDCKEQTSPGVWTLMHMKFRAHYDFVDGARDYWRIITGRYASALPFFDGGSPAQAAAALRQKGYFTANLAPYAKAMVSLYSEFTSKILPILNGPPQKDPA